MNNMNCIICQKDTYSCKEGTVCKECRKGFEDMTYSCLFVYCINCDKFGFPCKGCADTYFEGFLGPGNGPDYTYNKEENKTLIYIYDMIKSGSEDNLCQVCYFIEDEGRVCQDCRQEFLKMVDPSLEDYDHFLTCINCDTHGFPCYNCANYIFKGELGLGDDILDVNELLTILYNYDDSWNDETNEMCESTGSNESIDSNEFHDMKEESSDHTEDNSNQKSNSSYYCSIQ